MEEGRRAERVYFVYKYIKNNPDMSEEELSKKFNIDIEIIRMLRKRWSDK